VSFPSSGLAGFVLISFLCATLAPCPTRIESGGGHDHAAAPLEPASAAAAQTPAEEPDARLAWARACPCGCERAPLAGSSARLGVALPSSAPWVAMASAIAPRAPTDPIRIESFAPRIEHVPLATLL